MKKKDESPIEITLGGVTYIRKDNVGLEKKGFKVDSPEHKRILNSVLPLLEFYTDSFENPMDGDETQDMADAVRLVMDYWNGNIDSGELEDLMNDIPHTWKGLEEVMAERVIGEETKFPICPHCGHELDVDNEDFFDEHLFHENAPLQFRRIDGAKCKKCKKAFTATFDLVFSTKKVGTKRYYTSGARYKPV